jgi:hypothetical protein
MDWLAMITAIKKTGMAGYFSDLLFQTEAGLKIPVADADALKRAAHRIAAHNALCESECAKLLKGLSAAGITHQEHFKLGRRRHRWICCYIRKVFVNNKFRFFIILLHVYSSYCLEILISITLKNRLSQIIFSLR